MKRTKLTIAALLLGIGLTFVGVTPTHAAPKGNGANCAQIVSGDPNYTDQFTGTATMFVNITTVAPSCKNVKYIATAYATDGTPINAQGFSGNGTTAPIQFTVATGGQSVICGTVKSVGDDGTVFDVVPSITDNGCAVGGQLLLNGGSGAGFWK